MQVNADIDAIKKIRENVFEIDNKMTNLSRRLNKGTEAVSLQWNDEKYIQLCKIIGVCQGELNKADKELSSIAIYLDKIIKYLEDYESALGLTTSSSVRTDNRQAPNRSVNKEDKEVFKTLEIGAFFYEQAMEFANSTAQDVIGRLVDTFKDDLLEIPVRDFFFKLCDQLADTKWSDAPIACSSAFLAWQIVGVLACPPSIIISAPGMIVSLNILRKQRKAVKEGSSVKYCDIVGLNQSKGMEGPMIDVATFLEKEEERSKKMRGRTK